MNDITPHSSHRGTLRSTPRQRVVTRTSGRRLPHRAYEGSMDGMMSAHSKPAPAKVPVIVEEAQHHDMAHDKTENLLFWIEAETVMDDVTTSHFKPFADMPPKRQLRITTTVTRHIKRLTSVVPKKPNIDIKAIGTRRFAFGALAIVMLALTGYVSADTWITNNRVQAVYTQNTDAPADADPVAVERQAAEGRDESKPSQSVIANHSVAADEPRRISIPTIGVDARILPMGVNPDNSVQAPLNIYDAGWYTGSVKPGKIGAMFIDAHASGPTREGLFGDLDKLVVGNTINIEKGDGTQLTYRVVHTEIQSLDSLDMKKVLLPYGKVQRALNLMTCTGTWVESGNTFDKRVIVYTEQIS